MNDELRKLEYGVEVATQDWYNALAKSREAQKTMESALQNLQVSQLKLNTYLKVKLSMVTP